jgi:hypothetical protein
MASRAGATSPTDGIDEPITRDVIVIHHGRNAVVQTKNRSGRKQQKSRRRAIGRITAGDVSPCWLNLSYYSVFFSRNKKKTAAASLSVGKKSLAEQLGSKLR